MIFGKAIDDAILSNLTEDKKFVLMGLVVSYSNKSFFSKFPERVLETPVSELSFSGMAVGLASQGFKPMVDHGRVEFSILALDQILTQASRWNFMFGGDYFCPASFKICIGRQWGNGPQHTGTYHSIFLQSLGMDIFIPSTPLEAYLHIKYTLKNMNPSVILEHRWLYLNDQNFKIHNNLNKIHHATYVKDNKSNILIVTYGDGFVESLKAKKILKNENIDVSVISLSYFPKDKRISESIIKEISKFEKIYYVDTSPFDFGLLSSFSGIKNLNKDFSIIQKEYKISPPFYPCPTSPMLTGQYYPNGNIIAEKIIFNEKNKKIRIKPLSFYETHTVTKVDLNDYLKDCTYIY